MEELEKEIADLEDILKNRRRVRKIITDELSSVIKKHGAERRTKIVYNDEIPEFDETDQIDDYPVTLFLSREGYFKKITPLSLRMGGEQKYKENDSLRVSFEATNRSELLVFTDRYQVYKTRASDFEDTKASALGSYLPAALGMDDGENAVFMVDPKNYTGQIAFFFENGKALKTDLAGYATKQNRKKLTGAYSDKSPLKAIIPLDGDIDVAVYSTDGRAMIFNTKLLSTIASRSSQGVTVMSLKKKGSLENAVPAADTPVKNYSRYKVRSIPAAGALLRPEDRDEIQLEIGEIADE